MTAQKVDSTFTLPAAADLSAHQFKFMVLSSGQAALAGTIGVRTLGVLQNTPAAAGRDALIAYAGIVKIKAGGSITANDKITTTAAGLAQTAASTHHVAGIALTGAASGDLVSVLLISQPVLA